MGETSRLSPVSPVPSFPESDCGVFGAQKKDREEVNAA